MDVPELIEIYLSKVRDYIDDDNFVFELQDRINLTNLGIAYRDALQIIKTLNYTDYVSGPEKDHLIHDQNIYVFGHYYDPYELYIKITFRIKGDLFIMSFHEAKYEMTYPYK